MTRQGMSISVCIPCYRRHLPHLLQCLRSIDEQTCQPTEIIVSCSDTTQDHFDTVFGSYRPKAPFKLLLHTGRKNASENRNIAASEATTEYLSFFDADDRMHPQRMECIVQGFRDHPDAGILLHGYTESPAKFIPYDQHAIHRGVLDQAPSLCPVLRGICGTIHCSQCSVRKDVWASVRFNEETWCERREDAIFSGTIVGNPSLVNLYCPNELSAYVPEGRWYTQNPKTAFVTLCDSKYLPKAQTTIRDLRSRGKWTGDIVLILVECDAPPEFLEEHKVVPFRTTHIDTKELVYQLKTFPLKPMADNRHLEKLTQWDKLQVFRTWFKQWDRIAFLDAGLRVVNTVEPLLGLDWEGSLLAPDDAGIAPDRDNGNRIGCQIQFGVNFDADRLFRSQFPSFDPSARYFLNCMFLFDTSLITDTLYSELETCMNDLPIMKCNEMGIMNLWFNIRNRVWRPFPEMVGDMYLFGWSEPTVPGCPNWTRFHFLKYPWGPIS